MPKFQAGNKGKPKGAGNRVSREARSVLAEILEKEIAELPARLKKLTARDRIEVLAKLLPYIFPRLQSVSVDVYKKPDEKQYDMSKLSFDELVEATDSASRYNELLAKAEIKNNAENTVITGMIIK